MVRMREEGVDTEDILNPMFGAPSGADEGKDQLDAARSQSGSKTAVASAISMVNPEVKRMISMEELQAHNQEHEPWFAVHGQVYDGTAFLTGHPGGAESITLVAGEDATEDFMAIHSPVSGTVAIPSA